MGLFITVHFRFPHFFRSVWVKNWALSWTSISCGSTSLLAERGAWIPGYWQFMHVLLEAPQNTPETHPNVRVEKGLRLRFESKSRTVLALVKSNRVKSCFRQGASSGALRGRLRRGPLTSREGGDGRGESRDQILVGSRLPVAVATRNPLPG